MRERDIAALFVAAAAIHAAPHIIVVAVDGWNAREAPNKPGISALMSTGAWTLHARAVLPTVSAPNWASMIMGAGPAQHGVTSNDWMPDRHAIEPSCKGPSGTFPTIFLLLRQQHPSSDIAIFHEWARFARIVEPGIPSVIEHGKSGADTMRLATAYLGTHSPDLAFIELGSVDDADRLIGELMKRRADTMLLLTAAQGGAGDPMSELEIPWIISGPGVRSGTELKIPVNQFDTGATLAYLLELHPPPCWIGHPVSEALHPRAAVRGLPEPGKRPPPSTIRMK